MAVKNTRFVNAGAVADYNQSHYIELPKFQDGMLDLVDRRVTILNRIQALPATGHPTRYWEQTKIAKNAKFVNPRNGTNGNYGAETLDEDYGRVEKSAMLKALTSEIKFTLFDSELVKQQGVMEDLLNKDMQDMIVDLRRTQNNAIWNGAATDLNSNDSAEYVGLKTQIKKERQVAKPVKLNEALTPDMQYIADEIISQIALQESDLEFDAYPTALYANPQTIDYIIKSEAKRENRQICSADERAELGVGFKVFTIRTSQGDLPLIADPFIKLEDGAAGKKKHTVYAINEKLIERHYLTSSEPRIFKMGLNKSLVDDYVAVQFDTVIAKGADAGAHFKVSFEI